MQLARQEKLSVAAALGAGLLLRAAFVALHPRFLGDTLVYGDLAHNLLAHGVYGLSEEGAVRSTLIRLPGYPLFLALCFALFGSANYLAVVWVQVAIDLLGCWLLGQLATRLFGTRAGVVCVWMGALCPFTANYAAAALTETLSIFCVVSAFWALVAWRDEVRQGGRGLAWAATVGVALSGAVLLRPDGVLLSGAVLPAMAVLAGLAATSPVSFGIGRNAFSGVVVAGALVLGCLGLWTLRNWRAFHVVQPLAPKYANDPGEPAPLGFARWYRTWGLGLADTARVYWEYDGSALSMSDLPSWAFDTPAEREQTARVYARYNEETSSTPAGEAEFARLAAERVRAHPVRFYVLLPLGRLGDMWLRPRTELLPKMPLDWWRCQTRPRAALFGWAYGLLNVALLGLAVAGLVEWRRLGWAGAGVVAAAMVGFVPLRSGLLMTIDNSEPRYVLECYPVVILLASFAVSGAVARRHA